MEGLSGLGGGSVMCRENGKYPGHRHTRIAQMNGLEEVLRGEVRPAGWRGGGTCGGGSWALTAELPTSLQHGTPKNDPSWSLR